MDKALFCSQHQHRDLRRVGKREGVGKGTARDICRHSSKGAEFPLNCWFKCPQGIQSISSLRPEDLLVYWTLQKFNLLPLVYQTPSLISTFNRRQFFRKSNPICKAHLNARCSYLRQTCKLHPPPKPRSQKCKPVKFLMKELAKQESLKEKTHKAASSCQNVFKNFVQTRVGMNHELVM